METDSTTSSSVFLTGHIKSDTGDSTITLDVSPVYNGEHDYFLISIALNGLIVALLAVIIFVKGFQSNAR